MKIRLDLSDDAKSMLRKMPELIKPALFKGMNEAMILAERESKLNLSGRVLQRRSGRLRNSITHQVKIEGDNVIGRIGTNVVYGRIHELGGEIRPKTARALRFQIPGVGWRMAQKVTIPKRPYLRPAIEENVSDITRILARRIEEAFEKV